VASRLKDLTVGQALRGARRKYIYRYDEMGYYVVQRGAMKRVVVPGYETRVVPGSHVTLDVLANPYVDSQSIRQLQEGPGAMCVLVYEGEQVVASNWFLRGTVHVHELNRDLTLPQDAAYSCRTFTRADHRGRHLMGHMMTSYLDETPDCEQLCGVIYDWNGASVRGVVNLGWKRDSTMWTRRVLGWQTFGERRHKGLQ
jgi:hypothetical protein